MGEKLTALQRPSCGFSCVLKLFDMQANRRNMMLSKLN